MKNLRPFLIKSTCFRRRMSDLCYTTMRNQSSSLSSTSGDICSSWRPCIQPVVSSHCRSIKALFTQRLARAALSILSTVQTSKQVAASASNCSSRWSLRTTSSRTMTMGWPSTRRRIYPEQVCCMPEVGSSIDWITTRYHTSLRATLARHPSCLRATSIGFQRTFGRVIAHHYSALMYPMATM